MPNGNGRSTLNTISGVFGLVAIAVSITLVSSGGGGMRERVARLETAIELMREDFNRQFEEIREALKYRGSAGGGG